MKRLFITLPVLFAIVVFFLGCAGMQTVPEEERMLQQVHKVNLTKDKIYSECLEWMAETFVDSKAVIELKDKENGKIIGKGITNYMSGGIVSIPCRFTMKVEIKENKYRATYDNFIGYYGKYQNNQLPVRDKSSVDKVKANLLIIDQDLYNHLVKSKKGDSW